ncbi:MAG: HYC_CC_PP family protein [Flavisolibacter sp.]
MTLHFHFCCGQLKTVDLTEPEDSNCHGKSANSMDPKCCDDQKVEIKLKGEQHGATVFSPTLQWTALSLSHYALSFLMPVQNKILVPEIFAPPPVSQDLNQLYCTYRI